MISVVSVENAHLHGDVIPSIYKLRYQGFKVRQNYDVPSYNGMEYDGYDTPVARYLVWRDNQGIVRGCARISPTTYPYMIEDLWPESVQQIELPKQEDVWEASRFCIDNTLPQEIRKNIHGELLCAFQEYGLEHNIRWMIGVMAPLIWRSVFIKTGWPIEFLGPIMKPAPKDKFVSGKMEISRKILTEIRKNFEVQRHVLQDMNFFEKKKIA